MHIKFEEKWSLERPSKSCMKIGPEIEEKKFMKKKEEKNRKNRKRVKKF